MFKIGQPVLLRSLDYRQEEREYQGIVTAIAGPAEKPIFRITYVRFNDYGSAIDITVMNWSPDTPSSVKVTPAAQPFDFGTALYAAHLDTQSAKENLRRAEATLETLKALLTSFRETWAKQAVGEFLAMCIGAKDDTEKRNTH